MQIGNRFRHATRHRLWEYAEEQGCPPEQVDKLLAALDDDAIRRAASEAGVHETVGALGDGTLLKDLFAWLKTDQGRAFVKLLFTLLMGLI